MLSVIYRANQYPYRVSVQTAANRTSPTRALDYLRNSALPYLISLVFFSILAPYANYLADRKLDDAFLIKGQSLTIVIQFIGFPITLVLWALLKRGPLRSRILQVFLFGLIAAWVVHFILIQVHQDLYAHVLWLYIPILLLLILKTPTREEAWQALEIIAWIASAILVLTYLLERLGFIPVFRIDPSIIEWEKQNYWIPISDFLGVNGRWPGPFGYNSKTGFVAAYILIVALARWRKHNYVLVAISVIVLLLTASRASFMTALAGLFVLALFTRTGIIARIPLFVRWIIGGFCIAIPAFAFIFTGIGLTGRFGDNGIWTAYIKLWESAPWVGVGQTGIWSAHGVTDQYTMAHNMFVQELAIDGIVGLATQYLVVILGLVIMAIAAFKGFPGPLAIAIAYLVTSQTEVLNDGWTTPSIYILMIALAVIAATRLNLNDKTQTT